MRSPMQVLINLVNEGREIVRMAGFNKVQPMLNKDVLDLMLKNNWFFERNLIEPWIICLENESKTAKTKVN